MKTISFDEAFELLIDALQQPSRSSGSFMAMDVSRGEWDLFLVNVIEHSAVMRQIGYLSAPHLTGR